MYGELQMLKKRCETYRMAHLENQELHKQISELKKQIKVVRKECKQSMKRVESQHKQDMVILEARMSVLEEKDAQLRGLVMEQEADLTQHKKAEREVRQKVELLKIQLARVVMERDAHLHVIDEASERILELLAHQDYLNRQLQQLRELNKLFGQRLQDKE